MKNPEKCTIACERIDNPIFYLFRFNILPALNNRVQRKQCFTIFVRFFFLYVTNILNI